MSNPHCLVIGGGVFGVTGAIELARRNRRVTLVDPGPLPHPDASSTDISKIIRMDYGADAFYCEVMERAMEGWRAYNAAWSEPLYHEHGFLVLTSEPLGPGTFEGDSFALLRARGHRLERLDSRAISARFPAWRPGRFVDGYFNPNAGWAESGRVVAALVRRARELGVDVRQGAAVEQVLEAGSRVVGARLAGGADVRADVTVVAAGAWTQALLPHLGHLLSAVAQPVVHFRPRSLELFGAPRLTPWAGDIQKTGFYGFPANAGGLVKVANHGRGEPVDPRAERSPPVHADERFRAFLRDAMPALADAPIAERRVCLYCDSIDGDFLIACDPERSGLVIAAGGSGHGFKFAPVLGALIADAVDQTPNPWSARFAWRVPPAPTREAARSSAQ